MTHTLLNHWLLQMCILIIFFIVGHASLNVKDLIEAGLVEEKLDGSEGLCLIYLLQKCGVPGKPEDIRAEVVKLLRERINADAAAGDSESIFSDIDEAAIAS